MFNLKQVPLAALLVALYPLAQAVTPDAGSLLRDELQRERPTGPIMPPKVEASATPISDNDTGAKVTVTSFTIVGLSAIPDSEAQAFLAPYLGQALSLNGLNKVADKFEKWLRTKGLFLARAYLPPQNIKTGQVEIRVLEGRVEGIDIKRAPDTRLPEETLKALVSGALPPGAALEQERLERGLLLANDLPGISARAVLSPGKDLGTSRVLVEAAEGPIFNGNIDLDNTGNRYTGKLRLSTALNWNDPAGLGEQWSLRATKSQGSVFFRAAFVTPLGSSGLKGGVNYINSHYALCCDDTIGKLKLDGGSEAYTAHLNYPLLRSRDRNLALQGSLSRRNFFNHALGTLTSDKSSDSIVLGANGDWTDPHGQGGYLTYGAQMTTGNLDLRGVRADAVQDGSTAQSQGEYRKYNGQATYLRRVSKDSAIYASFSGQLANRNLDSSEKFTLGGPTGVRAYPTGEAAGDEGMLVTLEWRKELEAGLRLTLFADYGETILHHKTWANWNITSKLQNRYALMGVGAAVSYTPTPKTQVTATVATRLGNNPGQDSTGRDTDGTKDLVRLWLQGSFNF